MPMRDRLARLVRHSPERPSLRERVALLKVSAARVLRRPVGDAEVRPQMLAESGAGPVPPSALLTAAGAQPDAALFAMEAQHQSLRAAADAVWKVYEGLSRSDPGFAAAEEAWNTAVGRANVTADEMAEVRATTLAGIQAKARCIRLSGLEDAAEGVVASVIADLIAMGELAPPFPSAQPDAAIIALADAASLKELTANIRCNASEDPPEGEDGPSFFDQSYDLLEQVTATRPGTIVSIAAKARVMLTHANNAHDLGSNHAVCALALSIAQDAVRLDYASGPSGVPLDLSALSVLQLSNYHEAFAASIDIWLGITNAPWARDAAGIADAEHIRHDHMRSAIAEEIGRRVPADAWDGDRRLAALIRDELLCNGDLRHAPALRAAITEQWSA